jgi:pilus biogenesis lipoprotein CpaD
MPDAGFGDALARTRLRRGVGVALALSLAGCAGPTTAPWGLDLGTYEAAPRDLIPVSMVAEQHVVRVARNGRIDARERDALAAFIAAMAGNKPESLRVTLQGGPSPAQAAGLRDILVSRGVGSENIFWEPGGPPSAAAQHGRVLVGVERAVAVAPNCPGFMGHPSAPIDNLAEPNFGCANVYNLAAMIGDPHHLRQGASSIYYLGQRGASDVTAYRTDKVKPLPREQGFSVTISSGGQQ